MKFARNEIESATFSSHPLCSFREFETVINLQDVFHPMNGASRRRSSSARFSCYGEVAEKITKFTTCILVNWLFWSSNAPREKKWDNTPRPVSSVWHNMAQLHLPMSRKDAVQPFFNWSWHHLTSFCCKRFNGKGALLLNESFVGRHPESLLSWGATEFSSATENLKWKGGKIQLNLVQ